MQNAPYYDNALFRITVLIRLGRHEGGEQGKDNDGCDHGLVWSGRVGVMKAKLVPDICKQAASPGIVKVLCRMLIREE